MNGQTEGPDTEETAPLPPLAPARSLDVTAPLRWLRLGWSDLRRAPLIGLAYGLVIVVLSALIALLTWQFGTLALYLGLASGFMFIAPALALGLYSVSRQIELGLRPVLGYCIRDGVRHIRNELVFAVVLLVIFLLWARAASMVHVFFPIEAHPHFADFALFLVVGSAIGAMFAGLVFAFSAFSLPMIMDRKVDPITAIITSVGAVLHNKPAMLLWAAIVFGSVLLGFATGLLGFLVTMPVIGHATWHAYRETIDASAWPENEEATAITAEEP
jgi:uncharacterized membrane protein